MCEKNANVSIMFVHAEEEGPGTNNKLPVDVIVCVSLTVSCVRVKISLLFLLLNFLGCTNTMLADIPTYSVLDFP